MALVSYKITLAINKIFRLLFRIVRYLLCVCAVYQDDKFKMLYFAILVSIFVVVKRFTRWTLKNTVL